MNALTGSSIAGREPAATLARALGFAALFGMAGLAAVASTHRSRPAASTPAIDGLRAEEARLVAERDGAGTIVFPDSLLARRGEPAVATVMQQAQQRLAADRQELDARRNLLITRIAEARAIVDLNESRRSVLRLQFGGGAAMARNTAISATEATQARAQEDTATRDAAAASQRVNRLARAMATLSQTNRTVATQRLEQVRARLGEASNN